MLFFFLNVFFCRFPQIRLYARPNAISSGSGDYALQITKRLLQFYEDYFKVKYSLPKLGKSRGETLAVFVTQQCPNYLSLDVCLFIVVLQEDAFGFL